MIVESTRGTLAVAAQPSDPYGAWSSLARDSLAGQVVTPELSLALTAVYGAVSMIANTCGTMPLEVIDTGSSEGRKVVTGGQLAPMLRHAPNEDAHGADLWTYVFACLLLRGNAYLAKLRDARGVVTQLYPLNPADVTPWRGASGKKLFRVRVFRGEVFVEADFTEHDILHVKGPSLLDPLVGASPIEQVRHALGTQLAQTEYQARAYKDGLLIKGVLSTPERNLNPEAVSRVKAQWKSSYAGVGASHDIAVLHSGISFQPVTLSPEDAQFIQTMKWGHTQVATAFQIPASRLNGDAGSSLRYANQAQDDLYYVKQACMPRIVMVEGSLNRDRDLFGATSAWIPKFDTSSALRADDKTRFENHRIEREIGTASQNDILRREDRPTIGPEGDDYTPLKAGGVSTPVQGESVTRSASASEVRELHAEPLPALRSTTGQHAAQQLMVNLPAPNIVIEERMQPAPNVVVNVPEQAPPVVNVEVAAPNVQVDVAAPSVEVAPPNVTVEAHLDQSSNKSIKIERDGRGFITGAKVSDA